MTEKLLPPGRYLSTAVDVRAEYGGQTRALLMRNRIFAAEAGIRPTVVTFGATPDIEDVRAELHDVGLLTPQVDLLNIYEYYRTRDWPSTTPLDRPLEDLSAYRAAESAFADGSPFQVTYALPDGRELNEYLRPDGSAYLRVPAFEFREPSSWPERVQLISKSSELVGEHPSIGSWLRSWIEELAPDDMDTFVFSDSRFVTPHLSELDRPRIHLVHLLHNVHTSGEERPWNGPLNDEYQRLLDHLRDVDAFVTLTERQRGDLVQRFGNRSHLFVVPNPIDVRTPPVESSRDPRLVTVVARLEPQKRLGHVLRAFRRVVDRVPDARLEIYGDGSRREQLEVLADKLGISSSVTFKGHDPRAREALWHSSCFVLTSRFEGYPLSTLESLSHGCPVVAYDIKYGPREQISDGVDGFVVPAGDFEAAADRIVRLLEDVALVERMSAAALRKAADHGAERFVADWAQALTQAQRLKPRRTRVIDGSSQVTRLRIRNRLPAALWQRRAASVLEVDARVALRLSSSGAGLQEARVSLDMVHDTGAVTPLPVSTSTSGETIAVRCRTQLRDVGLVDHLQAPGGGLLRLRVVLHNDAWETTAGRVSWADAGAMRVETSTP